MKRFVITCIILLAFAGCAGGRDIAANSISPGAATSPREASAPEENMPLEGGGMPEEEIIALAKSMTEKGGEVFWWYMGEGEGLEVEEAEAGDGEPVRPVGKFKTIAELKAATQAVYSRRFCEAVLYPVGFDESQGDGIKFREIGGVLHINLDNGGMGWIYALTDDILVKSKEENKIVVTIYCAEGYDDDITQVPFDFALVWEDDGWKLDNWFDYGTPEI